MSGRSKIVSALLLLGLAFVTPVLSGCHKETEETKGSSYYEGKDFKGHGAGAAASSQTRKGGD